MWISGSQKNESSHLTRYNLCRQETGIGKTVNSLREIDGEVGELASALITKWKQLINSEFLIFFHKKLFVDQSKP